MSRLMKTTMNFLTLGATFLFILCPPNGPQMSWATYQLPEEALRELNSLRKEKTEVERKAQYMAIEWHYKRLSTLILPPNLIDCAEKYENAREAHLNLIDQITFLANHEQEVDNKKFSEIKRFAEKEKKEFWNCKYESSQQIKGGQPPVSINFDLDALGKIFDRIIAEIRKAISGMKRKEILKAYSQEVENQKWKSWGKILEENEVGI